MALRTSSEASRMTLPTDLVLPSLRYWRRRRTMFSMSMMASSTTTPTAITKPARTMVLMVVPRTYRTRAPAIRDSGMATTLMSAEHHDHEHAADEQRGREIVERHLDEGRGPEDLGVDLDSLQTWLERLERLVYDSRHVPGICRGLMVIVEGMPWANT